MNGAWQAIALVDHGVQAWRKGQQNTVRDLLGDALNAGILPDVMTVGASALGFAIGATGHPDPAVRHGIMVPIVAARGSGDDPLGGALALVAGLAQRIAPRSLPSHYMYTWAAIGDAETFLDETENNRNWRYVDVAPDVMRVITSHWDDMPTAEDLRDKVIRQEYFQNMISVLQERLPLPSQQRRAVTVIARALAAAQEPGVATIFQVEFKGRIIRFTGKENPSSFSSVFLRNYAIAAQAISLAIQGKTTRINAGLKRHAQDGDSLAAVTIFLARFVAFQIITGRAIVHSPP